MWNFILGLIIGSVMGIVTMCICIAGDDPCEDCPIHTSSKETDSNESD